MTAWTQTTSPASPLLSTTASGTPIWLINGTLTITTGDTTDHSEITFELVDKSGPVTNIQWTPAASLAVFNPEIDGEKFVDYDGMTQSWLTGLIDVGPASTLASFTPIGVTYPTHTPPTVVNGYLQPSTSIPIALYGEYDGTTGDATVDVRLTTDGGATCVAHIEFTVSAALPASFTLAHRVIPTTATPVRFFRTGQRINDLQAVELRVVVGSRDITDAALTITGITDKIELWATTGPGSGYSTDATSIASGGVRSPPGKLDYAVYPDTVRAQGSVQLTDGSATTLPPLLRRGRTYIARFTARNLEAGTGNIAWKIDASNAPTVTRTTPITVVSEVADLPTGAGGRLGKVALGRKRMVWADWTIPADSGTDTDESYNKTPWWTINLPAWLTGSSDPSPEAKLAAGLGELRAENNSIPYWKWDKIFCTIEKTPGMIGYPGEREADRPDGGRGYPESENSNGWFNEESGDVNPLSWQYWRAYYETETSSERFQLNSQSNTIYEHEAQMIPYLQAICWTPCEGFPWVIALVMGDTNKPLPGGFKWALTMGSSSGFTIG